MVLWGRLLVYCMRRIGRSAVRVLLVRGSRPSLTLGREVFQLGKAPPNQPLGDEQVALFVHGQSVGTVEKAWLKEAGGYYLTT